MKALSGVLKDVTPALFIGNGVNLYNSSSVSSSWDDLLDGLALTRGIHLTKEEKDEMSNTEFFDILELAAPASTTDNRYELQRKFCSPMNLWVPAEHHKKIVGWAKHHARPIITVNFDENLSKAVSTELRHGKKGFTRFYPWASYFSDKPIADPKDSFAIWHAHGMMRYAHSIRLGLTHYMGAVGRARPWIVGKNGLINRAKNGTLQWPGANTWLEILFFSPLMILGFGMGRDENFIRWLFLERARLHKLVPSVHSKTWYVTTDGPKTKDRQAFFQRIGVEFVVLPSRSEIYEANFWEL